MARNIRDYKDIIDLDAPVSSKYPRMSETQRAAQFAPFDALSGIDRVAEEGEAHALERRTGEFTRRKDEDA